MAKVSNREDALLNAYLSRYKNAQASTVNEGQNKTQTARAKGAALLNATDKTLPVLKDTYSDTMQNIVQGASLENSLNNDVLNRQMKLAQAKFEQANDLYEQQKKAQQYAEKQAEKEAAAAAKAAAKAARSGRSSGKSKSKSGSSADSAESSEDAGAAMDALFGSAASTGGTAGSTNTAASSNKKDDEKTDKKTERKEKREAWQKSQREHHDEVLKAQEQQREKTVETVKNAGKSVVKAVVGGLTAPARGGNEDDKKSQYQKRQLVDSGRVFTKDGQVNQRYAELEEEDTTRKTAGKSSQRGIGSRIADLAKGTAKQAMGAALSFLEAPAGGGSQANKAAQYEMRRLTETGQALNADGSVSDAYQKALDQFENTKNDQDVLDEKFVPALGLVKEGNAQVQRGGEGLNGIGKGAYNIAAMGANMAPGMALGLVNPALGAGYMGLTSAGQKLAEETEKGMGSRDALLRGAASGLISTGTNAVPIGEFANITKNGSPILQGALKEGVENAGQEAADYLLNTAADYALKDPDANFSLQDMASQIGMGAATGVAFGALGGVLNRAGNRAGLLNNGQQEEAFLRKDALPEETFAQDATNMEQSTAPQNVPAAIAQNSAAQERIAQQAADALPAQTAAEVVQSVPTANATTDMPIAQQTAQSAAAPRNAGTAYMPDNTPVNYRWAAVDANDLVASNDALGSANPAYPKEYQNRNRDSAASMQQITRMANDLNQERLADSANIGDGSPVVRGDNVVLSGNGRTAAIQTAYRDGKADNYRNYVMSHAAEYGIDPSTLPENPVLVRVADDDTDMLKLARGANESTTASFGAAENAVNYGQNVTASTAMSRYNPDKTITDPANDSAVAGLLRDIVPESEYNRMVTKDGKVSLDGYKTAKDAMFAAAYGNSDRLQILAEGGDDSSRNITAAMRDSAANAITLKQMVERGELPQDFDVTYDVSGAADLYAYVKSGTMGKGKTVADYVAGLTQGEDGKYYDGFDEVPYTPMSMYIAEIMEDNRRSGKQTTEFLDNLYASAKEGEGGELTLEGMTDERTRQSIIDDAVRGFYKTPERSNNGKTAPNVPFAGEGWANPVGNHSANAAKVAEQVSNTAPLASAGGADALPMPARADASEAVPGMDIVENAQNAAGLNGSEIVHPNTVGSKEREMPYQEYTGRGHSVTDIDRDTLTSENQNILGTNAPYTVQRVSHAEQQANAQQIRSNEGLNATIDRIVKDSTSGNFNDETETLAGNTLRELNKKLNTLEPNTAEYARTATQARIVRSKMREGLTKTARTLESAKQFTTPEKAVMNVEGILNDARDAAQKKNPGAFKKAQTAIENAVEDGRSEANAQLGEIVTNELTKIVGAGKQAVENGSAGQVGSATPKVPVLDNPEDVWARAVARKTGNYAQDNLKKADPDDLFAKEIVNQLFETAKESPVAQGARVKNGYTAQAKLNLAFDAQDDYAAVWNKAKAIAQANYKNNPDMTSRLQAFFDNVKDEGSLYSNKTVLSAFTENLKENDDTFRQLADRAAFGNKSEISKAANRLADAVEVPDAYRSGFLKTAESVLANSKQLTGAQAHADGRAFRAALNRAGFTVGDIADASAFGNDISPVMAAHEIMETLNPPAEYRQTVFDNVYNYIKNNDGYQKQMEKADSRVLRRLVNNVDGGYTSIANKAAFGSDAGMQATVSDFLDEINAPTSLRGEMGERLQKAITGNTQYQKAAAGADSRVFNEAVRHVQEELEFTFQKLSGESDASKAKVLDGLKNTITDYLGVDDTQAAEVVQNIEKMYNSALSDGAMKRLAQIFPDTGKAVNAPRDQFLELLRSGAYNDEYMGEAVKDLAATKFGIQQLSDEQVANIKQLAEQMETLPKDSKARVDIENEIATIAAGNVRGSFWDKWNAMRYTGMLFNAVTNIKNAVNNVGQGTLALLKDGVNGAVQRVAKAMGNETADVTVGYLNPASKADRSLIGRAFADTENSRWRQLTGASENFEMAKAAKNAGQTFDSRVMRTIDQMSSAMLEDADVYGTSGLLSFAKPFSEKNPLRKAAEFAQDATKSMGENGFIGVAGLKNNYSRYLASYLKAHGATDAIFDATDEASKAMLEQARDYAVQQALVNTYHEANVLTDFIGSAKKSANKVPILGAWVEGQLPFVKTPTNVGIQAWRYSPGGLLQGLAQMGYDAASGKDINKAMDTFSAGLTGSALAGLGAYLWSTGHLVPGMTDEEKAEADLTGAQENSLQFTDENGKLHSYTINWLSNWAGPMMVGANLAKMWDTRNDNSTGVVDKVLNACTSVLDPVIDNSYLSSLNNTIDQLGNAQTGGEKAATLLTSGFGNYFTQAIPTLSGQLARTIDPTRRSTYTGLTGAAKNFAYFGQKSENKIPVLSKSNEPYIDVWGNEEKNFTPASSDSASDYAARAAYNFLSPSYYSESDDDAVSQYVEGLYKSTGDKNVLPKNSSARGYTVSVQSPDGDSAEQRLTPQEKTAYDKTYGQTAYDIVDSLRQNDMFLQLPEDQQSALVQDAYSVAKTAGGVAAVGDGVSGAESKEYEAYKDGGVDGLVGFMLMKNATDLVRDEKRETSGNDNTDLNTVETWNTLYSQFGEDAVDNFVNSTKEDSTVRNISDLAGDKAVTAYMQAYSAVAKTLDDDQTPDKFTVGYGMQKYGLSGDDFARAYLAAYYKKDKNGKYPEKGGSYADKAGAEIYQSYGADALQDWVNYRATIPDTNGNGKVDKDEAVARLNEMDLTNELRRAYLTKTNKQWKNPY